MKHDLVKVVECKRKGKEEGWRTLKAETFHIDYIEVREYFEAFPFKPFEA